MARYFQGESVRGNVFASSAETFGDVVAIYNICPQLPMTRKAFLALPKPVRQEKKHVPFFVAATFASSPSKRDYAHALHCNLLFLDVDEDEATGECPAAPFVHKPELLSMALEGFNFAAHTTASSTNAKPRMRVVVDAHEIPLADYPAAVRTIAARLGLPMLTRESKVAVQPMFIGTQFQDDTEDDHPMIISRVDARAFTVEDIADHGEAPRAKRKAEICDDLDFLRAPNPGVTLAIAKEALGFIDPDCSYWDWLMVVGAALRHQFSDQEEEAFTLFDEWSSEGSKYPGSDKTRDKWDSLLPTPVGRAPITILSLLQKATQSGWDNSRLKQNGYDTLVVWMESTETASQLVEQGIKKILSTPLLSPTQEGMLVGLIKSYAKERFRSTVSVTDLKTELSQLREKMKVKPDDAEEKKEVKWAKGLCFVTAPKEFYRPLNGEKYKPETFDLKYARCLLPSKEQLAAMGLPVNDATLSRPITKPTDYVLNRLKIDVFYDYAYAPQSPNEMLFVFEKRRYVNTYAPTYPPPEPEFKGCAGELFQGHLSHLIAEPEYRRVLTDFMAYMVQHPGKKIRWAMVVQGCEGAGKTYLAEVMKAVLGRRHVKTVDGTTITSGWNEWTFGYQMVVIEEVRVAGTNRHDIMNRLKPWITNEDIPINEKFRSSRDALNITNYMLFSNHQDMLAITPGDRRYYVIKSALQDRSQVLALGKNYFRELFSFLEAHPGAMRAYLADWEISPEFDPNAQAPRTKYTQELIEDSANELHATLRRLVTEADHSLIQYDIVSATKIGELLPSQNVYRTSVQQLNSALRDEGYMPIGRHLIGDTPHYLWTRGEIKDAVSVAAHRERKGLKNLGMELMY